MSETERKDQIQQSPVSPPPPPPPPPRPAVSGPTPNPEAPGDRDPFHRNRVNTEIRESTVPTEPSANLEREENYSRNEEIKNLVQKIRTGEWETNERQNRLEQKYGRRGVLRGARAWLGGESDFVYQNGELVYRWHVELARRAAHTGLETAKYAGISLAASMLTGGLGSAFGAAITGNVIGRGFAEGWRALSGKERGLREDIEIARIRYYQKAKEIADRIGPEHPDDFETKSPEEQEQYSENRNQAIKDLVNFVYASEQHGVVTATNERGRKYVRSQQFGQPIAPSSEPGEPIPGGQSGPTLSTGTEVYQPSEDAPNAKVLDEMENALQKEENKWFWIEEGLAFAGGMGGIAKAFLMAKAKMAETLAKGGAVSLDIDGDKIYHVVQKTTDVAKSIWHTASDYVFQYNNIAEATSAAAQNNTILPGIIERTGQHVSLHALAEGGRQIAGAITKEALQKTAEGAVTAITGMLTHLAWNAGARKSSENRFHELRGEMKQEQEMLRRRLHPEPARIDETKTNIETEAKTNPESRLEKLKSEAMVLGKPFPEAGQHWIYGDSDDKMYRAEVIETASNPSGDFVRLRVFDPRGGANIIEYQPIQKLLAGYKKSFCVEDRRPGDFALSASEGGGLKESTTAKQGKSGGSEGDSGRSEPVISAADDRPKLGDKTRTEGEIASTEVEKGNEIKKGRQYNIDIVNYEESKDRDLFRCKISGFSVDYAVHLVNIDDRTIRTGDKFRVEAINNSKNYKFNAKVIDEITQSEPNAPSQLNEQKEDETEKALGQLKAGDVWRAAPGERDGIDVSYIKFDKATKKPYEVSTGLWSPGNDVYQYTITAVHSRPEDRYYGKVDFWLKQRPKNNTEASRGLRIRANASDFVKIMEKVEDQQTLISPESNAPESSTEEPVFEEAKTKAEAQPEAEQVETSIPKKNRIELSEDLELEKDRLIEIGRNLIQKKAEGVENLSDEIDVEDVEAFKKWTLDVYKNNRDVVDSLTDENPQISSADNYLVVRKNSDAEAFTLNIFCDTAKNGRILVSFNKGSVDISRMRVLYTWLEDSEYKFELLSGKKSDELKQSESSQPEPPTDAEETQATETVSQEKMTPEQEIAKLREIVNSGEEWKIRIGDKTIAFVIEKADFSDPTSVEIMAKDISTNETAKKRMTVNEWLKFFRADKVTK